MRAIRDIMSSSVWIERGLGPVGGEQSRGAQAGADHSGDPRRQGEQRRRRAGGADRHTLWMAVCRELQGARHLSEGNAWVDALEVALDGAGRHEPQSYGI